MCVFLVYLADGLARVFLVPHLSHSIVALGARTRRTHLSVSLRLRLEALQSPAHTQLRQEGAWHLPRRRSLVSLLQFAGT